MLWALGLTALGASHAPLAQAGGSQFGVYIGPVCLAGLAAIVLMKRRYLELGESGLVDARILVTHIYAYENIQGVRGLALKSGAEGVILIECEVRGTVRRIRMSATQDRWPTLVAHLWRRLPLLQVDLSPQTTRRIEAMRNGRPVEVTVDLTPQGPLRYDLARTYGGQLLVALPAMVIVAVFMGGNAVFSCVFGLCLLVPVLLVAGVLDYFLARHYVQLELRPEGFLYRDPAGVDFWIPWGELTAVGAAGSLGSSLMWIHAREKTILIRGHLVGMDQVRMAFGEALRAIDRALLTGPAGATPTPGVAPGAP